MQVFIYFYFILFKLVISDQDITGCMLKRVFVEEEAIKSIEA